MKKLVTLILILVLVFVSIETNAQETLKVDNNKKNIIYFGDSIAEGSANNCISWDGYIQTIINFKESVNASRSGATFSKKRIDNMIVTQILKHKNEKYDYVLLQGGVNDAMDEAPLGEMSLSYELEDFDSSTYIGMLDITFYYLTKYYYGSSMGVMITYPTPNASDYGWKGLTSVPDEYYDALRKICDKWEIPYIDFYKEELSNVITEEELPDGLHLNDQGYQKISPYLADFIQALKPYYRDLQKEERIMSSGLKYYNETY